MGCSARHAGGASVRVLVVIDKLTRAGTQRHVVQLVQRLDRSLFEPSVLCLEGGGPLKDEVESLGIPVSVLEIRNWRSARGLAGLATIAREVRARRPAIVHSYLFTANVLVPPIARVLGVPVVITSRRDLGDWRRPHHVWLNRFANGFTDLVLANSLAVRRVVLRAERLPEERLAVVHNGIGDAGGVDGGNRHRARWGLPGDALVVGSVGNLRGEKDPMTLLRAFASVATTFPEAQLVFAGRTKDTLLAGRLIDLVRERGLATRVHFLGSVDDVPGLLSALDVYASTSVTEGFSNAILEAMRAGLPVVASDAGGNAEQVVHQKTGLVFPVRDHERCAEALRDLLADPRRRAAFGAAGRVRQREFFLDLTMARKFEAVYGQLLVGKARKAHLSEPVLERLAEKGRHVSPRSPVCTNPDFSAHVDLPAVPVE